MKYLMNPLFLIVALLTVWSSQAMAGLSEADVRNMLSAQQALEGREDELLQLMPEKKAELEAKAEAEAAWEREYEEAVESGDRAKFEAMNNEKVAELVSTFQGGRNESAQSFDEQFEESVSHLRENDDAKEFVTDIVRPYGFSDADEYLDVMRSVGKASILLMHQKQVASIESRAEMYRNYNYTEEQIAELIKREEAMYERSRQFLGDVPDSDVQAVAPFQETLLQNMERSAEDEDDY
ncbi:hypothetical protein [Marinobacter sp. CA1]|uniref:hypothetical protein n=1 Tax=Marinobacter sp. CA1 TaxID=2817656 RepID=UPI001D0870BD|nr:hypothetical protein [Marinobacter sp. CA1]UDL03604.1 hypothetical protein J2887_12715 [Marinobacter sp. CA1]